MSVDAYRRGDAVAHDGIAAAFAFEDVGVGDGWELGLEAAGRPVWHEEGEGEVGRRPSGETPGGMISLNRYGFGTLNLWMPMSMSSLGGSSARAFGAAARKVAAPRMRRLVRSGIELSCGGCARCLSVRVLTWTACHQFVRVAGRSGDQTTAFWFKKARMINMNIRSDPADISIRAATACGLR